MRYWSWFNDRGPKEKSALGKAFRQKKQERKCLKERGEKNVQ